VLASALTRIPRTTEGFPIMANVTIPIQFAPSTLEQAILPGWQFSLFSVNLGESSNPEVEKAAIERIGSYGRQIGHVAEALEVVIEHLKLLGLPSLEPQQKDALKVLLGDVAQARGVKAHLDPARATAQRAPAASAPPAVLPAR
jgi:hypothetical protein